LLQQYTSLRNKHLVALSQDNVVPPSAKAVINHRVHPSQRVAEVIAYDREIIADPRVNIRVKTSKEAHPISPFGPDCIPFQMVTVSIKQVFTDAAVVPGKYIHRAQND
jgi:carboxypeptidase PM20D1